MLNKLTEHFRIKLQENVEIDKHRQLMKCHNVVMIITKILS